EETVLKESKSYKVCKVFNYIILLLVVYLTVYPFLNILAQSFSSEAQISAGNISLIPNGFNLDTYKVIMGDKMFWINYKKYSCISRCRNSHTTRDDNNLCICVIKKTSKSPFIFHNVCCIYNVF